MLCFLLYFVYAYFNILWTFFGSILIQNFHSGRKMRSTNQERSDLFDDISEFLSLSATTLELDCRFHSVEITDTHVKSPDSLSDGCNQLQVE